MSMELNILPADPPFTCRYQPFTAELNFVSFYNGTIDVEVPIRDFCEIMKQKAVAGIDDPSSAFYVVTEMLLTSEIVPGIPQPHSAGGEERLQPMQNVFASLQEINPTATPLRQMVRVSTEPLLEIGIEDFLVVCYYVLTNANLAADDPRRDVVRDTKQMLADRLREGVKS